MYMATPTWKFPGLRIGYPLTSRVLSGWKLCLVSNRYQPDYRASGDTPEVRAARCAYPTVVYMTLAKSVNKMVQRPVLNIQNKRTNSTAIGKRPFINYVRVQREGGGVG